MAIANDSKRGQKVGLTDLPEPLLSKILAASEGSCGLSTADRVAVSSSCTKLRAFLGNQVPPGTWGRLSLSNKRADLLQGAQIGEGTWPLIRWLALRSRGIGHIHFHIDLDLPGILALGNGSGMFAYRNFLLRGIPLLANALRNRDTTISLQIEGNAFARGSLFSFGHDEMVATQQRHKLCDKVRGLSLERLKYSASTEAIQMLCGMTSLESLRVSMLAPLKAGRFVRGRSLSQGMEALPACISRLAALTSLELFSHLRLADWPPSLFSLQRLRALEVVNCPILLLPNELSLLTALTGLKLADIPFEQDDVEITVESRALSGTALRSLQLLHVPWVDFGPNTALTPSLQHLGVRLEEGAYDFHNPAVPDLRRLSNLTSLEVGRLEDGLFALPKLQALTIWEADPGWATGENGINLADDPSPWPALTSLQLDGDATSDNAVPIWVSRLQALQTFAFSGRPRVWMKAGVPRFEDNASNMRSRAPFQLDSLARLYPLPKLREVRLIGFAAECATSLQATRKLAAAHTALQRRRPGCRLITPPPAEEDVGVEGW